MFEARLCVSFADVPTLIVVISKEVRKKRRNDYAFTLILHLCCSSPPDPEAHIRLSRPRIIRGTAESRRAWANY